MGPDEIAKGGYKILNNCSFCISQKQGRTAIFGLVDQK
jgi:hypothetical protein